MLKVPLNSATVEKVEFILINDPLFQTILWLLMFFVVFFVFVQTLRYFLRRRTNRSEAFRRDVLLVNIAKEAEEQAEKEQSGVKQKKDVKEAIAVAETLYANLSGSGFTRDFSYWKRRLYEFLTGEHRHIGLELVVQKGMIKFFVVTPHYLTEYTEQQIQAIYPTSQVTWIEDYNIFQPTSAIVGTYLTLTQNPVLPIKTYKNIDGDPLDGITNTLSKFGEDEGAAIQILIRPAKPKWRARAWEIAKKMHNGKSFSEATRGGSGWITFFFSVPLKMVEFIFKEIFHSSPKKPGEGGQSEEKPKNQATFQKEEDIIKIIEENSAKVWFEANVRVICSAAKKARAQALLRNIIGSFSQFTEHRINNGFRDSMLLRYGYFVDSFIYRHFSAWHKTIFSSEELSSIFHFPLPSSETPNIAWLTTRIAPPPLNLPEEGLIMGRSLYRGKDLLVRIRRDDRRRHVYIIGKSGVGKSVLLEQMASQDILNGEGMCFIDPHGDTVDWLLTYIPKHRIDDVIYFDPSDIERPMGLNMLEAEGVEEMDFATQEMIAIFYQLVSDPAMIGPMFEHNMRNAMFTLMANKEQPGTIADIPRIFTDTEFQKYSLQFVTDPIVRAFWEQEMAKTSDFHKSEMLGYLISKVGRFVENSLMRNIIGQPKSAFDFSEVMNRQKIVLVNLSKGKIGEINSNLLGLIIVSKLQMAALRRASLPESERKDFYLYIDEFQNYITDSIATILSEARKYRLNLNIAHQYMGQLTKNNDAKIREAVLGNAGTMVSFKIGIDDAEVIAKEFAPTVNTFDLVNVEAQHAYIKLLVKNQATRAFTLKTIFPERGDPLYAEKLKQLSRLKYGRDRAIVDAEIMERTKLGQATSEAASHGSEASK
jgi:DNA helicase HerA-like ATPase